jgi:hypothetical protein
MKDVKQMIIDKSHQIEANMIMTDIGNRKHIDLNIIEELKARRG